MDFMKSAIDPVDLYKTLYQLRNEAFNEGLTLFTNWKALIRRKSLLFSALLSFYFVLRHRNSERLILLSMP